MTTVIDEVIDVHIAPGDLRRALAGDVSSGLTATPKELPPKWFYDERGSQLFDRITRLEEYYPAAAEREILHREAHAVIAAADANTIVELGPGSSDKTLILLDAARRHGRLERYLPFDVSEEFLTDVASRLSHRYPGLRVHGVVGDFDRHLHLLPNGGRRLVLMLGGTIGNYPPQDRHLLLTRIVAGMGPGDHLLLGTDLVKDTARLELAYDDPSGVTAAFNRNVLEVVNRELGGHFDPTDFVHVARFDEYHEWIEMFLRSVRDQVVRIDVLELDVWFRRGELMRTEISAKFHPSRVRAELAAAGLDIVHWWTDAGDEYGLSLSVLA